MSTPKGVDDIEVVDQNPAPPPVDGGEAEVADLTDELSGDPYYGKVIKAVLKELKSHKDTGSTSRSPRLLKTPPARRKSETLEDIQAASLRWHEENREAIENARETPLGCLVVELLKHVSPARLDVSEVLDLVHEAEQGLKNEAVSANMITPDNIERHVNDKMSDLSMGRLVTPRTMSQVPSRFAKHPTLNDSARVNLLKLHFPTHPVRDRYQGDPPKNGLNTKKGAEIVNILSDLTSRQENMMLSEEEFKQQMKNAFSGRPLEIVKHQISQESSIASIYKALEESCWFAETPKEAKLKLEALTDKNHTFCSLSEMLFEVGRLAKLAAFSHREEASRFHSERLLTIETLLRLIPSTYRAVIEGKYIEINAQRDRDMTTSEFSRILRLFDEGINLELKALMANSPHKKHKKAHNIEVEVDSAEVGLAQMGEDKLANVVSPLDPRKAEKKGTFPRKDDKKAKFNPRTAPIKPQDNERCQMCWLPGHLTEVCPSYHAEHRVMTGSICTHCGIGYHAAGNCHNKQAIQKASDKTKN